MRRRIPMIAAVAACLGACSSSSNAVGPDDGGAPNPDASLAERCAPFAGKTFVSLALLACDITTICHWHVTFSLDGKFSWQHSDLFERGTYDCNGNSVTGTNAGGSTHTGQWTPLNAELSWMGDPYEVESP